MAKYEYFFKTVVGNVRKNNEDNFYANGAYKQETTLNEYQAGGNITDKGVFAVFDGIGGEDYGEKASLIAAEKLSRADDKSFSKKISEYIQNANIKVCDMITESGCERSGSTAAIVCVDGEKVNICNLGDSRIYLFSQGVLKQLSEDHTQVAGMVRSGLLTPEQAKTHKNRHIITQYLGVFPDEFIIEPFLDKIVMKNNDVILLCSDGLTDMVSDEQIRDILAENNTAEGSAEKLIAAALENGGRDNTTVGIIKMTENKNKSNGIFGIIIGLAALIMIMTAGVIYSFFSKDDARDTDIIIEETNKGRKTEIQARKNSKKEIIEETMEEEKFKSADTEVQTIEAQTEKMVEETTTRRTTEQQTEETTEEEKPRELRLEILTTETQREETTKEEKSRDNVLKVRTEETTREEAEIDEQKSAPESVADSIEDKIERGTIKDLNGGLR